MRWQGGMLRIHFAEAGGGRLVRAEGRIVAETFAELEGALAPLISPASPPTLDLADVTFVDRPGAALLRALVRRGVVLTGGSPYIRALLEGER